MTHGYKGSDLTNKRPTSAVLNHALSHYRFQLIRSLKAMDQHLLTKYNYSNICISSTLCVLSVVYGSDCTHVIMLVVHHALCFDAIGWTCIDHTILYPVDMGSAVASRAEQGVAMVCHPATVLAEDAIEAL